MTTRTAFLALCALPSLASAANTGSAFYGDAPDEHHPWAVHDRNRPQPPRVEPGTFSSQTTWAAGTSCQLPQVRARAPGRGGNSTRPSLGALVVSRASASYHQRRCLSR